MAQETTAVATRDGSGGAVDKLRSQIEASALSMVMNMLPESKAKAAAAKVGLAFETAKRISKNGEAWKKCTKDSIGACIARSAITGLFPGGPSPAVYLIPRGNELSWEITHIGWGELAKRQGYMLMAIPVYRGEPIRVTDGEAHDHEAAPEGGSENYADLLGVYVIVRRLSDGVTLCRPWVSKAKIDKRKTAKGAGPVWGQWPIEMAQKTAIKYCAARGYLPVSGDEWNTALASGDDVVIDTDATEITDGVVELPPEPEAISAAES